MSKFINKKNTYQNLYNILNTIYTKNSHTTQTRESPHNLKVPTWLINPTRSIFPHKTLKGFEVLKVERTCCGLRKSEPSSTWAAGQFEWLNLTVPSEGKGLEIKSPTYNIKSVFCLFFLI